MTAPKIGRPLKRGAKYEVQFGIRMTKAERQAITETATKLDINDVDFVRKALDLYPGFRAKVKRIEASAT